MKIKFLSLSIACCFFSLSMPAQTIVPLYPEGKIPNSKPNPPFEEKSVFENGILLISGVSVPTITVYHPVKAKANGMGIIIFPGGGYSVLASGHEGSDVAKAFNELGITAFVLKYRLPDERIMITPEIGPLQDGLRAVQLVRENAKEYGINPNKIGIIGFSAGGHLASTVGTKFNSEVIPNAQNTSLRPDFIILGYPVISSDTSRWHKDSFDRLLGTRASVLKLREYSTEHSVTAQTPPAFLFHASDDDAVKPGNSIVFYEALLAHHVPAELHIYQGGGHGFGLKNTTTNDKWIDSLADWLRSNHWLK